MGYWPFNGNANDESGNNHHGSVNGATLTEDRFGNANSAYASDGANDYIGIAPSSLVDNETTATLSFWLKRDALDGSGLPIHTGNQGRIQTFVQKDSLRFGVTTNSDFDGTPRYTQDCSSIITCLVFEKMNFCVFFSRFSFEVESNHFSYSFPGILNNSDKDISVIMKQKSKYQCICEPVL